MEILLEDLIDELGPLIGISFLGSCIHEYAFNTSHPFFIKNINIWISTIVTSIICFAIDPWLIEVHPRLIFLPPLLIGLAGMDLVQHLSTVKGNLTILEYILGFVGINRKGTKESSDQENNNTHQENYDELDNLLSVFFYLVTSILSKYYTNKDTKEFLKQYHFVKKDFDLLNSKIITYRSLPLSSTLLFTTIIKKVVELDSIYANIIAKSDKVTTSK